MTPGLRWAAFRITVEPVELMAANPYWLAWWMVSPLKLSVADV